ncbi:MAG TPA: GNAT family N-acetyltransferase [Chitinophagaceae bacterium]
MQAWQNIQYLLHDKIDKAKWDRCIETASNGLIYGYSFYLDAMAKHWDALILNDYEAVMPLTWNKKYGIQYLFQPFLTAQLGVFGNNINATTVESFLQAIPSKLKFWDIYLNYKNVFALNSFSLYQRNNYVLSLNRPYDEIKDNYRENTKRNIRRTEQAGSSVEKGFDAEKVIELALYQMQRDGGAVRENVDRFRKLYNLLSEKKLAITYGIFLKEELLASAVFFYSHKRAYYILVGNHPNGKTIGASHALIDAFIKDHAGSDTTLDFEGSDIHSLAFFYSSFGAVEEKYAALKLNRLPFYLKWMKR